MLRFVPSGDLNTSHQVQIALSLDYCPYTVQFVTALNIQCTFSRSAFKDKASAIHTWKTFHETPGMKSVRQQQHHHKIN